MGRQLAAKVYWVQRLAIFRQGKDGAPQVMASSLVEHLIVIVIHQPPRPTMLDLKLRWPGLAIPVA